MGIEPAKVNPSACGGQAAVARLSIVKNGIILMSPVAKDRMAALWQSQPGQQLVLLPRLLPRHPRRVYGAHRGRLGMHPLERRNPACCAATRPGRASDRTAPIAGHMNAMRPTGGEANGCC